MLWRVSVTAQAFWFCSLLIYFAEFPQAVKVRKALSSALFRDWRSSQDVIESPDIVKTGANIRSMSRNPIVVFSSLIWIIDDGQKLFRDFGILAKNLVELGAFAHQADSEFSSLHRRSIVSLAKMVERYTSKTLDKGNVRISNWERAPLSERQRECEYPLLMIRKTIDTLFSRCC